MYKVINNIIIIILLSVLTGIIAKSQTYITPMIGVDLTDISTHESMMRARKVLGFKTVLKDGFQYPSPTWGLKVSHRIHKDLILSMLLKYSRKYAYLRIDYYYNHFWRRITEFIINFYTINIEMNYNFNRLLIGLGCDINLLNYEIYLDYNSVLYRGIATRLSIGYMVNNFLFQLSYIHGLSNDNTMKFPFLGPFRTFNISVGYRFEVN